MLKNYRWLPLMLLVLGVWIATPACVASIHSPRGDYRQNVQRRAYDEGHRKGFDRGRDDARHGRPRNRARVSDHLQELVEEMPACDIDAMRRDRPGRPAVAHGERVVQDARDACGKPGARMIALQRPTTPE